MVTLSQSWLITITTIPLDVPSILHDMYKRHIKGLNLAKHPQRGLCFCRSLRNNVCEVTKICAFWRTWSTMANFSYFYLKLRGNTLGIEPLRLNNWGILNKFRLDFFFTTRCHRRCYSHCWSSLLWLSSHLIGWISSTRQSAFMWPTAHWSFCRILCIKTTNLLFSFY